MVEYIGCTNAGSQIRINRGAFWHLIEAKHTNIIILFRFNSVSTLCKYVGLTFSIKVWQNDKLFVFKIIRNIDYHLKHNIDDGNVLKKSMTNLSTILIIRTSDVHRCIKRD